MADWFAVIDTASGKVVSEATVIGVPLRAGLAAVPVDGPSNGRPWDNIGQRWGAAPVSVAPAIEQARVKWQAERENAPEWAKAIAIALRLED